MATQSKTANGGNKSDVSIEDLSAQIEVLKSDISSLTSALGNYGKSKGEAAAESAKRTAQQARSAGEEKLLESQAQAEDFIRKQPATALGIAAGVGFLIGLVTARR